MEKKFYCTNPKCSGEEKDGFKMVLAMESIMDEKNVAQMFCPHCKEPLTCCDETEIKSRC